MLWTAGCPSDLLAVPYAVALDLPMYLLFSFLPSMACWNPLDVTVRFGHAMGSIYHT